MLSKLSAGEPIEGTIIVSLSEKSIGKDVYMVVEVEDWTKPIREFILNETLLEDATQARKIRTMSAQYVLIDNQLYRIMENWSLLKCVRGGRWLLYVKGKT